MTLPAGFGLVRAERQGDRAVAIGESQDYDPVGGLLYPLEVPPYGANPYGAISFAAWSRL